MVGRRLPGVLALLVVLMLSGTSHATAEISGPAALADLNAWRAELGLPAVVNLDARMSEACRLHNAYRGLNGPGEGHNEAPSHPGYTALGDAGGSTSVLGGGGRGEGPRGVWEYAVYHRVHLLNPRLRTTWWSDNDGYVCMGTVGGPMGGFLRINGVEIPPAEDNSPAARSDTLVSYPSPADGTTGVPVNMHGGENPDPRDAIPGRPDDIGWLLTVTFNGPWYDGGLVERRIESASVTPEGGAPAAVTLDPELAGAAIGIFPNRPLAPGTWYTAHAVGTITDPSDEASSTHRFDVGWRFQTAFQAPASYLRLGEWERGRRCRGLVRCVPASGPWLSFDSDSPAPASVRITRIATGEDVTTTTIAPDTGAVVDLAPGRYRACFTQPPAGGFEGASHCVRQGIVGYPALQLPRTVQRTRDGRSLRVVVGADPLLIGRLATALFYRARWVCGSRIRRSLAVSARSRCERQRYGPAYVKQVRLAGRTVLRIPAAPRGFAMYLDVKVPRFEVGDARYFPQRPFRYFDRPHLKQAKR